MWQAISNNTKIIIGSIILLMAILIFSSWEKSATLISKEKAETLIESAQLEKLMVKEPYLYISMSEDNYKVGIDAIDKEKLFTNHVVDYYEESTEVMDMILFIVLLAIMFYILYLMRESRQTQERFVKKQEAEVSNSTIGKLNIVAQRSNIDFSDVAGIEDVKEELD